MTTALVSPYLLIAYIAWRMAWANRMPIMDCDEVYNYWEPLHYLQYGTGMQTWEYAPEYALRTYAYLLPLSLLSRFYQQVAHALPIDALQWMAPMMALNVTTTMSTKFWTFLLLRSSIAGITAYTEYQFCNALAKTLHSKSVLPMATLLLLLTSTGMAHASGAYLPSSTIMTFWLYCASQYLQGHVTRFIGGAIVATLAVGWPFGVIVFVPMGLHILWLCRRTKLVNILTTILIITVTVQGTVMVVDRYYYNNDTWVSPIVNIVLYNAKNGGDELYGVEPTSYYVKNLMLNFNYVALLGIMALPVALMSRILGKPWPMHVLVCLAPMYLWLAILLSRPHKEERFLFPIYPSLCLGAAMTAQQLWDWTLGRRWKSVPKYLWIALLLFPSCLISVSRTMALSKYYTAPLAVYASLPLVPETTASDLLVCTCGEWYRFPSSYTLPQGYQLGYLPSSFKGQLPKAFGHEGTFNDENREEKDRYVTHKQCSYVVAMEEEEKTCVPKHWVPVVMQPYLDKERTVSWHRFLYLPYFHESAIQRGSVRYSSYGLYQPPK